MSLVNYSSDEEEEEEELPLQRQQQQQPGNPQLQASAAHASGSLLAARQANFSSTLVDASLKLPDAAQLFASFDSVKESTVVNLSGGALSSKKRPDLNGSADAPPKKIPKGSLVPLRIVPDTAGRSLLPPQLRGRSNIVTEDLDKLFARKTKNPIEPGEQQP